MSDQQHSDEDHKSAPSDNGEE